MFKTLMLAVICAGFLALPALAERVDAEKAGKLAHRYAKLKRGPAATMDVRLKHAAKRTPSARTGSDGSIVSAKRRNQPDDALYYVFNIEESTGGGFIIVAGDDAVRPILGYSGNGNYDESNPPPNFAFWMEYLQQQIAWAQEQDLPQSNEARLEWDNLLYGNMPVMPSAVEPLIKTTWAQRAPYNNMCPLDGGTRSATGCVATAMAQIMKYHNYPARGTGQSQAYISDMQGLSVPAVNFEVNYDWGNMQNTYAASTASTPGNDAVATLMYHAGVSVKMDYGSTSSGAYIASIPSALINHFGYDKSMRLNQRRFYADDAWDAMLAEQIDAGLPVYYSGANSLSGHAFILDGYDNTGMFHFNWGWTNGLYNGYFVTTALNPGTGGDGAGSGTYNNGQAAIINIKPDEGGVPGGYESALTGFSASKNAVLRNESFRVSVDTLRNASPPPNLFPGGQMGAALINSRGVIDTVIGIYNGTFAAQTSYNSIYTAITFNCSVPAAVQPGEYKLAIVTRPTGGTWKIAELASDGITRIAFTVIQPVTGITFDKDTAMLMPGSSNALAYSILPANATNKTVSWTSSNPGVATVNDGIATALSSGKTTVTVTTEDGSKTAYCYVEVGPWYEVTASSNPNNSGTLSGSGTYITGTEATITATASDYYWFFVNWTEGSTEVSTDPTYTFTSSANVNLVANFKRGTYPVTFLDGLGSALKTDTVEHGADAVPPDAPTRANYNFTGWSDEYKNVTGTCTSTALWAIKTYTVTFVDGAGATLKTETVSHGGSAGAPAVPPRSGFTFDNWDTAFDNITGNLTVTAQWVVSILAHDRLIPGGTGAETGIAAPTAALTGEFTAGPNPAAKSSGTVNFFRQGKRVKSTALTVFNVSGNIVCKMHINDDAALIYNARRAVGSWNLTDMKGHPVSAGTYLVKGVLTDADGKKEMVSLLVGIR